MAISNRGLASFIFLMILTSNLLYKETCQAIGQDRPIQHRKSLGSDQPAKNGNSGKTCASGGDYCFVKKRGYVSDKDIVAILHVSTTLTINACMDACMESSCGAFLTFDYIAGFFGCIFFQTRPDVTQDTACHLFDVYFHTPIPGFFPPAGAPADAFVPPAEPAPPPTSHPKPKTGQPNENPNKFKWWILFLAVTAPAIALCFIAFMCCARTENIQQLQSKEKGSSKFASQAQTKATRILEELDEYKKLRDEMQTFKFNNICIATDQFSPANKLGEGGFGPVYKGILNEGQEVAVKRLSRSSSQGMVEFKNEIELIAKLQHNNLVKLLGCCIEGSEKILVYEFLTNKSLDSFLFDPAKKTLLDWKKRLDIIEGTAQGLLYLHKHSRLKVIHRDMKTSNILLDTNLKPKISDFGMARIFEQDTSEANTKRVVGTYGYMSPEYAMAGVYSEKSDVFSFGVIVLEIMTGKKVTSFSGVEHPLNLIRYAWDMWKEGKSLELIDQTIEGIDNMEALIRHIHVGLLCVEENAAERPAMSIVLSMLTNMMISLPDPKQPAFHCGESAEDIEVVYLNETDNFSPNFVTESPIEGR